jgi:hypothetical protein
MATCERVRKAATNDAGVPSAAARTRVQPARRRALEVDTGGATATDDAVLMIFWRITTSAEGTTAEAEASSDRGRTKGDGDAEADAEVEDGPVVAGHARRILWL